MNLLHTIKIIFTCLLVTILFHYNQVHAFFCEDLEQRNFHAAAQHYEQKTDEYKGNTDLVRTLTQLKDIFTQAEQTPLTPLDTQSLIKAHVDAGQALLSLYEQDASSILEEDTQVALLFKQIKEAELTDKAVLALPRYLRQENLSGAGEYKEGYTFIGLPISSKSLSRLPFHEQREPGSHYSKREILANLESPLEVQVLLYFLEGRFSEVVYDGFNLPSMFNGDALRELTRLVHREGVFVFLSTKPEDSHDMSWAPEDKQEIISKWSAIIDVNPFSSILPYPGETDIMTGQYKGYRLDLLLINFFTTYINSQRSRLLNTVFPSLVEFYPDGPLPYSPPFFVWAKTPEALERKKQELEAFKEREQQHIEEIERNEIELVLQQARKANSHIEKVNSGSVAATLVLGVPPQIDMTYEDTSKEAVPTTLPTNLRFPEEKWVFLDVQKDECEDRGICPQLNYPSRYLYCNLNSISQLGALASVLSGKFKAIYMDSSVSKFLAKIHSPDHLRALSNLLMPGGEFVFEPFLDGYELDDISANLRKVFREVSYDPQGNFLLPFLIHYELPDGLFRCIK